MTKEEKKVDIAQVTEILESADQKKAFIFMVDFIQGLSTWPPLRVMDKLLALRDTYPDIVLSMLVLLLYAEKVGKSMTYISKELHHDLNCADEQGAVPRLEDWYRCREILLS